MSETQKCWSADNETFNYTELGDLLDSNDELEPGRIVYVGDAEPAKITHLCDSDDVLNTIADRAYDVAGEYAEDCADVSAEAKAELDAFLSSWIERHCNLNFWRVRNVKEYMLTEGDFA